MKQYRLPQEMIDAIIENLHVDDDRMALLACSQVCHSWLPPSQRHLFRQITFGRDGAHSKRLGQVLLSSPHLANYIRALEVHMCVVEALQATCQTLAVMLRMLRNPQRLELCKLVWHRLTVDLRQSFRRVLLLPSMTSIKLNGAQFDSMDDFVNLLRYAGGVTDLSLAYIIFPFWKLQESMSREDQGENEDEPRLALHERRHLSHLHLNLQPDGNFRACVECLVGPRSPAELSHIHTLRVMDLDHPDGDRLNRLLRAIGSSLEHLQFYVPDQSDDGPLLGPFFDINLEFNPNIKFLHLTNIDLSFSTISTLMSWLLRFLSNIEASNQLLHILFDVVIDGDEYTPGGCSTWEQVDRVLAGNQFKFRQLQKVDVKIWVQREECEKYDQVWFDEIAQSMAAAHPLLLERGVSVDAQCVDIGYFS